MTLGIDEFIGKLAPNGESVRIQMGATGRVVYGQLASGEERRDLTAERLATLVDAMSQPAASTLEGDYSKKRPAIEIQVDGKSVFRQERDGVVSVNQVQQIVELGQVKPEVAQPEPVVAEAEPEVIQVKAEPTLQPKVPRALAVAARLAEALPISNTKQLVKDWVSQTTVGAVEKAWKLSSALNSVRAKSEQVLGAVHSHAASIQSILQEQQVASVVSQLLNHYQQELLTDKSLRRHAQDYTTYKGQNYTLRLQGRHTYEVYENGHKEQPLMRFKSTAWGFKVLNNQLSEKNYRDFQVTQKKLERFGLGELAPGVGRKHLGKLAPVEQPKQQSIALEEVERGTQTTGTVDS